jgi:hypothetical protein
MKIGYKDFWMELSTAKFTGQIKDSFEDINKKIKRKYTIGLKLATTDLVYQRGIVKISLEQIAEIELPLISILSFRKPLLQDIFTKEQLIEYTEEKSWDEPEDENCDIYLCI